MAALYAAGVAMGFSPDQVKAMSLWEFAAVTNGFARQHSQDSGPRLTEDEKADLVEWIFADAPQRQVRRLAVWEADPQSGRLKLARHVEFEG